MSASEPGWGVGFPDVDELLTASEVLRERLNVDEVAALWTVAAKLTGDVAEQAWIVVYATAAGWTPERLMETGHARWLESTGVLAGRTAWGGELGITRWGPSFDAAVAEDDAVVELPEVEHLGYGLLAPPVDGIRGPALDYAVLDEAADFARPSGWEPVQ